MIDHQKMSTNKIISISPNNHHPSRIRKTCPNSILNHSYSSYNIDESQLRVKNQLANSLSFNSINQTSDSITTQRGYVKPTVLDLKKKNNITNYINFLQREIKSFRSQNEELKMTNNDLRLQNQKSQDTILNMKRTIDSLNEIITEMKSEKEIDEVKVLKQHNAKLKKSLIDIEMELTKKEMENKSLKEEYDLLIRRYNKRSLQNSSIKRNNSYDLMMKPKSRFEDRYTTSNTQPYQTNHYLYSPFDENNLICFDMITKDFQQIRLEKSGTDNYQDIYFKSSTIFINALDTLYVVTGRNCNHFFRLQQYNKMVFLRRLKYNHVNGGIIYDSLNQCMLFLSGIYSNNCESFSFKTNQLENFPSMNIQRSDTCYCISNNILFAFFGYSYYLDKYINFIEYIDLRRCEKWDFINYKSEVEFGLKKNLAMPMGDFIIIFGGMNKNKSVDKIIKFDKKNSQINFVEKYIPGIHMNKRFLFNTAPLELDGNIVGIDEEHNVHIIDKTLQFHFFRYHLYENVDSNEEVLLTFKA